MNQPTRIRITDAQTPHVATGQIYDVIEWRYGIRPRIVGDLGEPVVLDLSRWEPVEESPAATDTFTLSEQFDVVNKAAHYNQHPSGIECIDVIEHMGFCLGNVIKYVWRADLKGNSLEDLKKARYYLDREIAKRESSQQTARNNIGARL